MADFKQAIREKNRVAHTQVLRSEFENMSETLASISEKNSLAQKDNEFLLEQGRQLLFVRESIKVEIEELNKQIDEKIKTLESKEQETTARCDDKETKSKSLEQKSRDKVLALEDRTRKIDIVLGEQVRLHSQLTSIISSQQQNITSGTLTLDEIHVKILESNEELRTISLAKTKQLTELDKQIKDKSNELETVVRLVDEERAKISKPMELLRSEEQRLMYKEKDLNILQGQVQARWQLLFPGSNLPI